MTTAKDSAADDPDHDPSAPAHDLTMRDGAGFSSMARRGDEDTSLWLDSSNPDLQQAYADSSSPVVNTAHSFTGFLRGCPGLQAGEESDSCGKHSACARCVTVLGVQ
ncbi:hypothetical protein ABZV67_46210 [Streptomyces sp. NPDC005065]|uniref:hypothetical protein n=1 Tax=Streptomyces sp. NPDC005065 TaxID=3154461 RepID=UPI0033B7D047